MSGMEWMEGRTSGSMIMAPSGCSSFSDMNYRMDIHRDNLEWEMEILTKDQIKFSKRT